MCGMKMQRLALVYFAAVTAVIGCGATGNNGCSARHAAYRGSLL
jgi:hypothetical protein